MTARLVMLALFAAGCRWDAPFLLVRVAEIPPQKKVTQLAGQVQLPPDPNGRVFAPSFRVPPTADGPLLTFPTTFSVELDADVRGDLCLAINGLETARASVSWAAATPHVSGVGVTQVDVVLAPFPASDGGTD